MSDSEFAKTHLREHLAGLIIPHICEGFWSIQESATELCRRNGQLDQNIRTFQNMLTRIPTWSDSTITTEVERIINISKCKYLDDLIMGVFIAYMKSFASLHYRGNSTHIKIDFERPSLAKFVHELYKQSARKIWQVAYLFKVTNVSSEQQARNRQDIEKLVSECMEQVIRGFLPWEAITRNYFVDAPTDVPVIPTEAPSKIVSFEEDSDEEEEEEEEEEYEAPAPKLTISEEVGTIEFSDLDKPKEEEKKEEKPKEDDDPLKEIDGKVSEDTLVINM